MPPDQKPRGLEVAIVGEGLSPVDVSIVELAKLLEATAEALAAVAEEGGLPPPRPSLAEIKSGSAVYVLTANEPTWADVVHSLREHVASRGKSGNARTRHALTSMYRAGSRLGALRLCPVEEVRQPLRYIPPPLQLQSQQVMMVAPLEAAPAELESTTTVYGTVVGINSFADHTTVKIELIDSDRHEFEATDQLAEKAAKFFRQKVRASAVLSWRDDKVAERELVSVERWTELPFLETMKAIREEIDKSEAAIDVDDWLRSLDE